VTARRAQPDAVGASDALLLIIKSDYRAHTSEQGDLVLVPRAGLRIAHVVNEAGDDLLEGQLLAAAHERYGAFCSDKTVKTVLRLVRAQVARAEPIEVSLRVAKRGEDTIYHDLGHRDSDRAVRITPSGWRVVRRPNVVFYRTARTRPLPRPSASGGDLDALWDFVNVPADQRPVLLGTLVSNLDPRIPQPIRVFSGEYGTGKTFAARRTSELIDPLNITDWDPPRSDRDWYAAAAQAWLVPLDEVKGVKTDFGRLLNKAVTGGGHVSRELFKDARGKGMQLQRAISITTTGLISVADDVASRMVQFNLSSLQTMRDPEALEQEWEAVWPKVLAGLYDLTAEVLAVLPEVSEADVRRERTSRHRTRFVGFLRRLEAIDRILGTDGSAYYQDSVARLSEDVLAGNSVTAALVALVARKGGQVEMTARGLLLAIRPAGGDVRFPDSPEKMSAVLAQNAEHLRRAGFAYDTYRDSSSSRRRLHRIALMQ
jgi:hypothetical protein